ncbi:MAG: hypothetical protein LBB23_00075 [Rickettsiales bacterium]|nr:hypothetical protein [Rickettsiales bacterium]
MQDNLRNVLIDLNLSGVKVELNENVSVIEDGRGQREETIITTTPSAYASLRRDTPSPAKGTIEHGAQAKGTIEPIIPKSEPVAMGELIEKATEIARACDDIESLVREIRAFNGFPTAKLAKNMVAPKIGSNSDVLIVIDAVSLSDDAAGEVLTGEEGELFNKMMAAIGLSGPSVFPIINHRLPGGRGASTDEAAVMHIFFSRFLELSGARRILTFGQGALSFVVPDGGDLPKVHGQVIEVGALRVVATFGLKFLLGKPEFKKDAWGDLQVFKE